MDNTQMTSAQPAPNPRRKFYLLAAITKNLGPDLTRRELSVTQLEQIARDNNINTSQLPIR